MSLEAAEQIANMMVMEPYPGYEGRSFTFPCRNVVPKPVQKPHPPMWMACTNRDTIKIAASLGLGALAFSFLDEAEARTWSRDLLRHHQERRLRAARPPRQRQHRHGLGLLAASRTRPRRSAAGRRASSSSATPSARSSPTTRCPAALGYGRSSRSCASRTRWPPPTRAPRTSPAPSRPRPASARPAEFRKHVHSYEAAGVDQIILLQQAGRNAHADICASLELFAARGAARVQGQGRRARGPQGRGARALHRQGHGAQEGDGPTRRRRHPRRPRLRRQADGQPIGRLIAPAGTGGRCRKPICYLARGSIVRPPLACCCIDSARSCTKRSHVRRHSSFVICVAGSQSFMHCSTSCAVCPAISSGVATVGILDGSLGALPPAASAPVASSRDVEHTIRRVRMGGLRLFERPSLATTELAPIRTTMEIYPLRLPVPLAPGCPTTRSRRSASRAAR